MDKPTKQYIARIILWTMGFGVGGFGLVVLTHLIIQEPVLLIMPVLFGLFVWSIKQLWE